MADNQLTITNGELVALTQQGGLDTVLKPLIREIFLFDSYIAGTSHLKDKSVFDELQEGCKLTMQREDNKFDEHAIVLFAPSGKKAGYVPEADNAVFSRLLDAGKMLTASVKSAKKINESFMKISIGIYLVDL